MKILRLLMGLSFVTCSAGFAAEVAAPPSGPAAGGASAAETFDPADAPPELRGVLMIRDERRFALTTPGGTQCAWVGVGEAFNDWQVVEYREAEYTLVVSREGVVADVPLATARILPDDGTGKATLAQAEALIAQMNFKRMFGRMMEQQKEMTASMMRQTLPKEAQAAGSMDELVAFQKRVVDAMWAEMNPEQMEADMAKAYAEIFTPAELRGMAEFYATAAGHATIDKQPELQQRLMQSMMPRIMAAMPKIRQMGEEFKAAQKQKAERAAAGGKTGHADATPAP